MRGSVIELEHVNPTQASVWARNDYGPLTAKIWWITDFENEDVLYSSGGSHIDGIFTQMLENGRTGNYILHFSMEDESGGRYTLSRRFTLQAEL